MADDKTARALQGSSRIAMGDAAIGASKARRPPPLLTPDGRYLVVRGRLWRASDPSLAPAERGSLVAALMTARRAIGIARRAGDRKAEDAAHHAVDEAKVALGERGPIWGDDGAPDLNRRMARDTHHAGWFAATTAE